LTAKGKIPVEHDFETLGDDITDEMMDQARPFLMSQFSVPEPWNMMLTSVQGQGCSCCEREKERESSGG